MISRGDGQVWGKRAAGVSDGSSRSAFWAAGASLYLAFFSMGFVGGNGGTYCFTADL